MHDEIILSLSHLAKISEFRKDQNTVRCQAGVILDSLSRFCEEQACTVPLDLGAKGSCMIGGNAATNAGGNRLIRYKSLRENIKELKLVTGRGDALTCTGPLMQIFIGSEGSLGVITEVLLQVPDRMPSTNLALLTCDSFAKVLETLAIARKHLFEILSAYEFLDAHSYELLRGYLPSFTSFFSTPSEFYVVVETQGANGSHDLGKLEMFVEEALEKSISNGIIANGIKQTTAIWNLRENCGPAASHKGMCLKYDISTPISEYYKVVESVRRLVGGMGETIGFGHVADGNVHINVAVHREEDFIRVKAEVEEFLYKELKRIGGSISAEHGIGLQKAKNLAMFRSSEEIKTMVRGMQRILKKIFDPQGILNPYKVLPY